MPKRALKLFLIFAITSWSELNKYLLIRKPDMTIVEMKQENAYAS